ncbi:peptidyl-prolyl cis-trans isomerase [Pseudonocardia sp. WMMC193]|uniref:peptidyl-prolyl cis-trans isomerase n=1 Tax=Pseudonocardia sp. WMMC193 TaxID=2911965 RepID=UPI001F021B28|nr:peptidyl-prolyl cis-trans isomerase [Pseudonocardia sp. WMMC193]MCF7550723.1 peptidyl-prolyl cis-trans isomerase [Pseudonocardia sp. WMMC193]
MHRQHTAEPHGVDDVPGAETAETVETGATGEDGDGATDHADPTETSDAVDTLDGADAADTVDDADAATTRSWWPPRVPTPARGRIVAAVLAVVLLAGAGTLAWWRVTALPEDAAFRYAGQVTTVDQLDQRIDALRALYGVEEPQDPAEADAFRRDVAKSVALSDILDDAAAADQVVVADKQVSDTLDRYIEQQFGTDGRAAFVTALGNVGTSEAAVRDEVRRQLTVSALMTKVVGTITVTDDDVEAAYDERRATLGTPERRSLRNIVVKDQAAAQAALDQLRSGAPIETVAAGASLDASTRDKGGALGDVAKGELEASVGEAAFAVAPGAFYGPVQGEHGWNVGRVDGVTPFVPASLDQVAAGLKQALQVERTLAVWKDWLGARIQDADVEYADAYRPADPDAVPSTLTPTEPAR